MSSRICGRPALLGKSLLVTLQNGSVVGVRLDSGVLAGTIPLGSDIVPAAAAVPFGVGRILVPLADGTLLWSTLFPTPAKVKPKETL